MFIDAAHNGTPSASNRAWHSILVGTLREGTAFEGQTPCPAPGTTTEFQNSASSVYALDVTQPEPSDGSGNETSGSFASPGCLDGGTGCPTAWPKVLWEIQDPSDTDGNGYPDMGESWSKPGLGRICVAKDASGNCTDERYVALFGGGFDRERKNRRGNWIYIVDVETGFVLYKAKSGTANFGSSNVSVNFASVPSETSSIDLNNDGLLDFVYFEQQMLGRGLRDLRSLKIPTGAPTTRWASKLQNSDGSALSAMLIFQAPQPVSGSTQYFPIYYRPSVVYLGLTTGGQPILGVGFGTGDRDDIISTCDATTRSTSYNQRFYFVVDKANTVTVTESTSGMLRIANSAAGNSTSTPAGAGTPPGTSTATLGERVITTRSVNKYIYVFTSRRPGTSGAPAAAVDLHHPGGSPAADLPHANGKASGDRPGGHGANASFATNRSSTSGGPVGQRRSRPTTGLQPARPGATAPTSRVGQVRDRSQAVGGRGRRRRNPTATETNEAARRTCIQALVTWNAKKPRSQRMKRTTATVNIFSSRLPDTEVFGRLSRPETVVPTGRGKV